MQRILRALFAACLSAVAAGQTPGRADAIPVLTVCEALQDLARYNGESIIVVGRFSNTRESFGLSADCTRNLVTDGHTWPDSIAMAPVRRDTQPPPQLPGGFKWDAKLVAAKLKDLQKTTKLRPRPGNNDKWMAIFGRLETRVPPPTIRARDGVERGFGAGSLSGSPAQLVSPQDRHASKSLAK